MTPTTGAKWASLADALEREIRAGQHRPGLPGVRELAAARGVSTTTAVRAVRALATRGVVVAVPGAGTFVADPLPPPDRPRTVEERLAALEERLDRHEQQHGRDGG